MTSEIETGHSSKQPAPLHLPMENQVNNQDQPQGLNNLRSDSPAEPLRDRFELLSAYLDGEVTAAERRQVEGWLANDAAAQCLYRRLLKLRQGMRSLPVAASGQPIEQTVNQVFVRIDRHPRRAVAWGGAIAALLVGAFAHGLPSREPAANLAQSPASANGNPTVSSVALMIPLDRPVIEIPKAAVSTPGDAGATTPALYRTPDEQSSVGTHRLR